MSDWFTSVGSHCFGYHCLTFIDNWSWLNGYKNRYGLYRLDLNDMNRTPKASARWYAELIKHCGFN
ncbi:family 1 glycosylhydrolase [Raoultella planticola]|uniref:family 1 glycosylhydrolase n=1 Tax=Raoultella planticola TaxID=575 RepID=UPI0011849038|nr:family 1 glycosylhydrolase [Raoultella planticola]